MPGKSYYELEPYPMVMNEIPYRCTSLDVRPKANLVDTVPVRAEGKLQTVQTVAIVGIDEVRVDCEHD